MEFEYISDYEGYHPCKECSEYDYCNYTGSICEELIRFLENLG